MDRTRLDRDGFLPVDGVLDDAACDALIAAVGPAAGDGRGGRRGLLADPAVRAVAGRPALRALVVPVLGERAFAVRATLFDKVAAANWRVPWHRDRLVAVRARHEAPGWRAWSEKDGVLHGEPPRAVLERMLAVRLHLDAVGPDNGPLRVLPGSHRDADEDPVDETRAVVLTAARGAALLMRPLLRHASVPAVAPMHRRVLHLEYAAEPLPDGLEWADAVAVYGDRAPSTSAR